MIKTIDLNFQGIKSTVACFLLKINKELALIECGPESCLKNLKSEIKKNGDSKPIHCLLSLGSAPSLGAPVPEDPINTFLPSGKVTSLPFAIQRGRQSFPLL